jgi:hypothetical protein
VPVLSVEANQKLEHDVHSWERQWKSEVWLLGTQPYALLDARNCAWAQQQTDRGCPYTWAVQPQCGVIMVVHGSTKNA